MRLDEVDVRQPDLVGESGGEVGHEVAGPAPTAPTRPTRGRDRVATRRALEHGADEFVVEPSGLEPRSTSGAQPGVTPPAQHPPDLVAFARP